MANLDEHVRQLAAIAGFVLQSVLIAQPRTGDGEHSNHLAPEVMFFFAPARGGWVVRLTWYPLGERARKVELTYPQADLPGLAAATPGELAISYLERVGEPRLGLHFSANDPLIDSLALVSAWVFQAASIQLLEIPDCASLTENSPKVGFYRWTNSGWCLALNWRSPESALPARRVAIRTLYSDLDITEHFEARPEAMARTFLEQLLINT